MKKEKCKKSFNLFVDGLAQCLYIYTHESKKPMQVKKLRELKDKMSDGQKRKLLVGLRRFKEGGNIGGTTDIVNADNLQTNENEFTGGNTRSEPNVIAKTFATEADFDGYVQQRRGIEITPKEQQAISNFQGAAPTQQDRFVVKFEATDEFGLNDTIIIKKLRDPDSGQFCWTAFSKHESAEDEGQPSDKMGGEEKDEGGDGNKESPELPDLKEVGSDNNEITVGDPIRITKSITFADDTRGADILADFMQAIDI